MKLRSATPVSTPFSTRVILVAIATILAITIPIQMGATVKADPYDDQMSALQREIDAFNAQARQLNAKAQSLQAELAKLEAEKAALQKELDLSQVKFDKLTAEIKANEQKIADNREVLGETIADLYVDNKISPLEMLASSKNIGDYVDKQANRTAVRDTLSQTIEDIKALKQKNEQDKKAVEAVLNIQKAQKESLVAKEQQQADLIAQTKGEEAAYNSLVASNQQKLQDVSARQAAYYRNLLGSGGGGSGVVGAFNYSNWSGNRGCGGGYPYCGPQDTSVDPWGLYNRECVSYVAWALEQRFGKYVANFNGQGNAMDWPSSAPRFSGAYRVYSPQPGDAVILPASGNFAPIGHAMIVESVSGNTMHVSQFNFYGTGEYSTMDVQNSGVVLLRFQNR
jgi:peptidoglycan hydrolase CwlO-like protein